MWLHLELLTWTLNLGLQSILLLTMGVRRLDLRLPFLFFWVLCDLIFSLTLYAVNMTGGWKSAYPVLWDAFAPITAGLLLAAGLEQARVCREYIGIICAVVIVNVAMSFDSKFPHGQILGIVTLAAIGAVVAVLWVWKRVGGVGWVLMVYTTAQAVEHLMVIYHAPRWHAGLIGQVVCMGCFVGWVYLVNRRVRWTLRER